MTLFACFQFLQISAEQFIYPVADFDQGNQLIILYQKSLQEVELWFLNPGTDYAIKGLSSFSTPANVRILPSGKGFSFIDQGYIKIKEFAKRSARTLSIYEPIGLFSNMHWIDEDNFYFVARQGDFFQIFTSNLLADVVQLTHEKADALYPQIIDSTIFYIRRDIENNFTIFTKRLNQSIDSSEVIIPTLQNQPCFLQMISATEGFYIQAPISRNQEDNNCYELICHHLKKIDNTWKSEKIFEFYIPLKYVIGRSRLYESIEPFLPNYNHKNKIYFTSWNQDLEKFDLQKYSIDNKTLVNIDQLVRKKTDALIFAPYMCNNQIHCGLIMQEKESTRNFLLVDNQLKLAYFDIN